MARFSEKSLLGRCFMLMALGEAYNGWQPNTQEMLVIDREPNGGLAVDGEYNAHGFDSGAMRASYPTHFAAREMLKDLQYGRRKLNPHRNINPDNIRIHEIALDLHAIDFDDGEHESFALLGALDAMEYRDRQTFKIGFPQLADLRIAPPAQPAFTTRDGRHPRLVHAAWLMVPGQLRQTFNAMADAGDATALPVPAVKGVAEYLYELFRPHGGYGSLHDAVEEVGKCRIGLRTPVDPDLLLMRIYDVNHTFTPPPPPPPVDYRSEAMKAIARQKPEVGRALLEALVHRKLITDPRPLP